MEPHELQSKSSRVWAWAAGVAIVLIAIGLGIMLFWAFASEDVLTVKNSPFPSRVIGEGRDRYVILDTQYCKNQDVAGKLRISFIDTNREIFLPVADENLPKGCADTSVPVPVPEGLMPDDYRIKFRVVYDINPLKQDVVVEFESTEFNLK